MAASANSSNLARSGHRVWDVMHGQQGGYAASRAPSDDPNWCHHTPSISRNRQPLDLNVGNREMFWKSPMRLSTKIFARLVNRR